jgi:hypothetical protein
METLSAIADVIEDLESDVVTLVCRQVVYSEIVISKDKFKQIQDCYSSGDYEPLEQLKDEMVTDEVMKEFGDVEETWIAFSGDVQQCTDDMIAWTDREWNDFYQLKV